MICPNCRSAAIYTKETAPGLNNEVYRRRWCSECDTKFRTVETIIEATDESANKAYSEAVVNRSAFLKALNKRKETK